MTYYRVVENYEKAEKIIDDLKNAGLDEDDINIVMKAPSNDQQEDMSAETLKDTDVNIEDAPSGTVSAFGSVFAVLTGITTGGLLVAAGPIAAAAGGGAVAAGGVAAALSGIGVPEEKHDEVLDSLKRGEILIHVEDKHADKVESILYS